MSLSTITPIKRGEEYLQRIADAIESSASELPTYGSGDAGKVLTVASGGSSVEWDEVEALPSYAAGDSGKVLGLTGSPLAPAWVQGGGGGISLYRLLAENDEPALPAGGQKASDYYDGTVWISYTDFNQVVHETDIDGIVLTAGSGGISPSFSVSDSACASIGVYNPNLLSVSPYNPVDPSQTDFVLTIKSSAVLTVVVLNPAGTDVAMIAVAPSDLEWVGIDTTS